MKMYDFFWKEFEHLKALTGINQWERLNNGTDEGLAEVNKLIDLMIDETDREPFDIVKPEVKQRIIHDAILTDQDFIGLNAKFVRKALNAWWLIYGGKILEARDRKDESVYQKIELTKEQKEKIDELANGYLKELRSSFPSPPKMTKKEIEEEGQIRTPKPVIRSTPLSYHESVERHRQYIKENYDMYTGKPLPTWISEEEWNKKQSL